MEPRTQERVEQWDSRPFSGGYDGLSDLADADFSGAVSAAGTWLFMLNGRIVGVVDGAIEDFEAASGTRYEAPDPALPLLCTMEEHGGETRAKYYTNETPLREVDGTLQSGSFTGYVELSENVLSGDYYAVYYGGRRMAAAYIGNADRLLTGDEAFERAADEVGIYEVRDVEIEVTDVPGTGPDSSATDATGGSAGDSSPATGPDADAADARAEPSADPTESALGSIDIAGSEPEPDPAETGADGAASAPLEDVTIGDATTDDAAADAPDSDPSTEPSGITATDADPLDSEPASGGITDAESADAAEPVGAVDDRSAAEPADGSVADEPVDERDRPSVDDRTQPAETATEVRTEAVEDDARARSASDADADANAEPDSETGSTADTSPDLAEVEAAAEQLEQNDISWTEDDVADSPSDEDAGAADAGATAGAVPESNPTDAATSEPDPTAAPTSEPESAGAAVTAAPEPDAEDTEETDERFDQEAQWRETRSIPSIDPDNSQSDDSSRAAGRSETSQRSRARREAETDRNGQRRRTAGEATRQQSSRRSQETNAARQRRPQEAERADASSGGSGADAGPAAAEASDGADDRVAELEERVETLEERRDELVAAAEELEAERDQLRSENEELSSTIDRLRSRIEELETELERAREADAGAGATPAASTQLSADRALADTNLFVRYASKSQPTLESAHGGESDRSDVAANLRLEHHTGFDAADVAVDGRPYEEFLAGTMEHRFVDWLTSTVLFEIRDTGNADGLGDLYDAIPQIDRAELDATISLQDDETEDVPDQVRFDVVAFDKMGNPLLVANLNDSREPATQGMLEEMEEAASAVKANYPDLAAAVVVTSSYFEPGALEVAEQATSGGLLSRGSKMSYVNLSRKTGYHLCLVESRSEGFHMNVPEL
ncbi:transcriptional regulator [Haloterrigena sp. SYSU A558-1]|uniref:Transcriptional regulator n=1 Tax=Haloterrigena gelatinilytica TaxID=2741724 RepID=A0ABX2LGJ1_9EURY|nr:transcriptional regulator [Haloterrigena gelatinilytica]NUC72966.1 transcriptional regulator [Haloterrigena gelatinilytica]